MTFLCISIAKGSLEEAAMVISIRKSKVMHIQKKTRVSATTEADVASLNLSTQMQRMRSRVYKAARPENPHGQMV